MSGIATAVRRDLPPPEEVFRRLQGRPGIFWLDSSVRRQPDGRYSVMGYAPRSVFSIAGSTWKIEGPEVERAEGLGHPLAALEAWLDRHRTPPTTPTTPFAAGAIGWFAYDLGRQFESIPSIAQPDGIGAADARLAWHDAVFVWDHATGESWIATAPHRRSATQAIADLDDSLAGTQPGKFSVTAVTTIADPSDRQDLTLSPPEDAPARNPDVIAVTTKSDFRSDTGRERYLEAVEAARTAIARGEVYQVNLAHRFEGELQGSPAEAYLELRRRNPAPFSFYQDAGEVVILGSSPERFVEVEPGGRIRTFPIKGTRPRGRTAQADVALRRALESSDKERAELLMIVDLLRNDLGRVCQTGTVAVNRIYSLETYATVHHLVAEIEGRLRAGVKLGELLRALFPGGSISGAPKVSALALIDRLERHRRGLFTGAMGYVGSDGRIDLNIAIRTIICRAGRACFQVGSGIVWDSDPAAEYAETLAKGRALFAALGAEVPG